MDSRIRIHMTESPRERANGREVEIARGLITLDSSINSAASP